VITVIDTETTGLEPPATGDGVVEVAWVHAASSPKEWSGWHQSLVKPSVPIEIQAMAAHHVTEAMIVSAPTLDTVLETLQYDVSGTYAAHNAEFDRKFLPPWLRDRRWICTWRCALHLWPDAPTHSNQGLRYYLNLDVGDLPEEAGKSPHRALYDAWVTAKLLERMLDVVKNSQDQGWADPDRDPVSVLLELSTKPVLLKKIRFGKHAGSLFTDVPRDYLRWLTKQASMDRDVVHTAQTLLNADRIF